ncbi:MAG: hypothetical protein ABI557_03305, partial [Aureliella sp.]
APGASPSQVWPLSNSQRPVGEQAAAPLTPASSGDLRWPDQLASIPKLSGPSGTHSADEQELANQSPVTTGGTPRMSASSIRQVICIVRESGCQDKVVTIDAPPEQLLQMIQQQSQK